jgi:hypothetical protein
VIDREPVKPTVALPLREALNDLTGFEVIGIEKHYGRSLEDLGGVRTLCGAVWAYENRDRPKSDPVSWTAVEGWSLRELSGYFAAEDPDPDSDQGKAPAADSATQSG